MTVRNLPAVWPDPGYWTPLLHGGGDGGSGGLAGLVELLLTKLTGLIETGASFVLFPGIRALALNVHPIIVHFPIAFLSAFFVLETIGLVLRRPVLRQVAGWMLYLGALTAMAAAAAGLIAAANVPHGAGVHDVMEWHERLMLGVAALALALAVWRAAVAGRFASVMAQAFHWVLAAVMVTLMAVGTDLGGLMVYQHGVGVAGVQREEDAARHVHTAAQPVRDGPAERVGGSNHPAGHQPSPRPQAVHPASANARQSR